MTNVVRLFSLFVLLSIAPSVAHASESLLDQRDEGSFVVAMDEEMAPDSTESTDSGYDSDYGTPDESSADE